MLFFYARAQQLAKEPNNVSLAILHSLTAMTLTYTFACYDVTFESAVCLKFLYCRPWMVTVRTNIKKNTEHRYSREIQYSQFTVLQTDAVNGAICKYRLPSVKVRFSWLEITYNKMEVRLHNMNINQVLCFISESWVIRDTEKWTRAENGICYVTARRCVTSRDRAREYSKTSETGDVTEL